MNTEPGLNMSAVERPSTAWKLDVDELSEVEIGLQELSVSDASIYGGVWLKERICSVESESSASIFRHSMVAIYDSDRT